MLQAPGNQVSGSPVRVCRPPLTQMYHIGTPDTNFTLKLGIHIRILLPYKTVLSLKLCIQKNPFPSDLKKAVQLYVLFLLVITTPGSQHLLQELSFFSTLIFQIVALQIERRPYSSNPFKGFRLSFDSHRAERFSSSHLTGCRAFQPDWQSALPSGPLKAVMVW